MRQRSAFAAAAMALAVTVAVLTGCSGPGAATGAGGASGASAAATDDTAAHADPVASTTTIDDLFTHPFVSVGGTDATGAALGWPAEHPIHGSFSPASAGGGSNTHFLQASCGPVSIPFTRTGSHLVADGSRMIVGAIGCIGDSAGWQSFTLAFLELPLDVTEQNGVWAWQNSLGELHFRATAASDPFSAPAVPIIPNPAAASHLLTPTGEEGRVLLASLRQMNPGILSRGEDAAIEAAETECDQTTGVNRDIAESEKLTVATFDPDGSAGVLTTDAQALLDIVHSTFCRGSSAGLDPPASAGAEAPGGEAATAALVARLSGASGPAGSVEHSYVRRTTLGDVLEFFGGTFGPRAQPFPDDLQAGQAVVVVTVEGAITSFHGDIVPWETTFVNADTAEIIMTMSQPGAIPAKLK